MIAYLKGDIISKSANYLIVRAAGGVGYKVFASANVILESKPGQEREFFIYSYIREDQFSLYGFSSQDELNLFELLISVSGVGPKMAVSLLSSTSPAQIRSAIAHGEPAVFIKVSGVGRKTAERLIIELREKIGGSADYIDSASSKEMSDSLDALVALGYSRQEAREAVKKLPQDLTDSNQIIRAALKMLGGR